MAAPNKEPLIRLVKRPSIPWWQSVLIRIVAIFLSLIVSAVIINLITKLNPLKVYSSMYNGAFGLELRTWNTIRDMMLLLCIAVGLAPAFKMKFWNIGAEGQILVGGIVSAACMIYIGDKLPTALMLVVMALGSALAGAVWGLIPAIFKAKWNTNETLFTLMMNYVAIQLTSFMVDIWDKKGSHSVGVINQVGRQGWFPSIAEKQYLLNVIIVLALTVIMFVYLKKTKQGYEISVVGESENTARYAGISVKKVILRTMLISGAICGIAGFIEVAGVSHTISVSTAGGRGFTAIIVAWLAKFNTFTMILISLLLVFLDKGAVQIATDFGLNEYASEMVTGIILFFILGSEFFINYKLIFRHSHKEGRA
jgi:simple sugar transport system permease protein